jgi:hypothetical protein
MEFKVKLSSDLDHILLKKQEKLNFQIQIAAHTENGAF